MKEMKYRFPDCGHGCQEGGLAVDRPPQPGSGSLAAKRSQAGNAYAEQGKACRFWNV